MTDSTPHFSICIHDEPLDPNYGKDYRPGPRYNTRVRVPSEEEFQDIFSVNCHTVRCRIERDRRYITLVDAEVIVNIHRAICGITPDQIERFLNTSVTRDEYIMLALYYNTFYHDKRIHRLAIKKEFGRYEDIMYFTDWVYSIYDMMD